MKKLVAYALVFVVCFGCCIAPSAGDDNWTQPAQLPAPPPPPPTGGGNSIIAVVSPNVYVQIALESLIL